MPAGTTDRLHHFGQTYTTIDVHHRCCNVHTLGFFIRGFRSQAVEWRAITVPMRAKTPRSRLRSPATRPALCSIYIPGERSDARCGFSLRAYLTRQAWCAQCATIPFEAGSEHAYFFDLGIIARGLLAAWTTTRETEFRRALRMPHWRWHSILWRRHVSSDRHSSGKAASRLRALALVAQPRMLSIESRSGLARHRAGVRRSTCDEDVRRGIVSGSVHPREFPPRRRRCGKGDGPPACL